MEREARNEIQETDSSIFFEMYHPDEMQLCGSDEQITQSDKRGWILVIDQSERSVQESHAVNSLNGGGSRGRLLSSADALSSDRPSLI